MVEYQFLSDELKKNAKWFKMTSERIEEINTARLTLLGYTMRIDGVVYTKPGPELIDAIEKYQTWHRLTQR